MTVYFGIERTLNYLTFGIAQEGALIRRETRRFLKIAETKQVFAKLLASLSASYSTQEEIEDKFQGAIVVEKSEDLLPLLTALHQAFPESGFDNEISAIESHLAEVERE